MGRAGGRLDLNGARQPKRQSRRSSDLAVQWARLHPGVSRARVGRLTVVRYSEIELAARRAGLLDLLHLHTLTRVVEITPGRPARWGWLRQSDLIGFLLWAGRYGRSRALERVRKAIGVGLFVQNRRRDGSAWLRRLGIAKVAAMLGVHRIVSRGQRRPVWELLTSPQTSMASTYVLCGADIGRARASKCLSRQRRAQRLGLNPRTTILLEKRLLAEAKHQRQPPPFRSDATFLVVTRPDGAILGADDFSEATRMAIDLNFSERTGAKYRAVSRKSIRLSKGVRLPTRWPFIVVAQSGNALLTDAEPGSIWARRRLNLALRESSVERAERPRSIHDGDAEDSPRSAKPRRVCLGALTSASRPRPSHSAPFCTILGRLLLYKCPIDA